MSKIYAWTAAAILGLASVPAIQSAAQAAPLVPGGMEGATNPNLVEVQGRDREHRWNRDRHGRRCMSRRGSCRHFHRGYYYETPWWTLPLIVGGAFAADRYHDDDYADYGGGHVQWCLDRYRSYNPRTNTWVSYSGRERQCISPYS